MTFTNREIRALLRQVFQDPSQSDTEYTHYEMFVNELFRQKKSKPQIHRKRPRQKTVGRGIWR